MAGGATGMAMWTAILPLDCIKTQVQLLTTSAAPQSSALYAPSSVTMARNVAKKIAREDGLRGFYRGYQYVMLRAFPVNATAFGIFSLFADS